MTALFVVALLLGQSPPPGDSGAVLYHAWCSACHGADGRGTSAPSARLEVPAANLADCATSSVEPEDRWVGVVAHGGAAYGLSLDMPAYGEAATREQIREVVRYIRSLCREPGWPPGELNFPRPFLVEKAFPENEWVIVNHGSEQEVIYERRVGRRLQLEAEARTDGVTGALKYNVWHSLARRALFSVGIEATPPVGRQDLWEIEPFLAFGAQPGSALVVQGQILGSWEDTEGVTGSYRLGVGAALGRVVPMVEAGWTLPADGERTLALYPQMWVQLSRLGHVAGSLGVELPAVGPEPRHPKLIAFVLWDYADGGLFRGW